MRAYTRVAAPFDDVVVARRADPGTLVSPSLPLLQIDSAGPLQLQATVDESAIGSVRKGRKITVSIDAAPSLDPAGTVAEIVPAADPAIHSFLVKIDLHALSQLRSGMYATATITSGSREAVVPRSGRNMVVLLEASCCLDLRAEQELPVDAGAAQ